MIDYTNEKSKLLRIGIFYDGNYFSHVSNYYMYEHPRKSRISVSGLHRFIVHEISKAEGVSSERCRIVDAHYFRGRLSALEAQQRNALFRERQFDEVLMREGIVSHFLPLSTGGEKGIDVWLALEALELAIHKRFDVVVLIAGDGDYLPLVRKLNTLGTRVCVLGWDFQYTDNHGNKRQTRTAQTLLNEANYPILMNVLIEDRARKSDPLINDLFLSATNYASSLDKSRSKSSLSGTVQAIKEGYGFIRPENGGENLFFHYSDLVDVDLFDLNEGDKVCFELGENDRGSCARRVMRCS
ncbi:NYN domain-containing protein [Hydrogenimonas thermophila]|uniref:Cold shock protein, CspA family n=1 Tax=Hydrogenimonas thermophila TaxID=223786 RepID=A0A1I5SQP6_9BACT|nr:NYN domain-containing protein [Hydrogenimonas thermophila]WOE70994.1 NYN domain-containing protein [Hydrogenimonas thermophila]WOE73512.1 NYN domain-containing protein [Hydrogenimonas thermophila]SFP73080.1 Cold shock protein, CspA family [Hydrogenimonas thermophila]